MQAAILEQFGNPSFGPFADAVAGEGEVVARVVAAAVSRFDIAFAAGRHYLKPIEVPFVAGREGIGLLGDGRRVYFDAVRAPYGSMAERAPVRRAELLDVPEGVDDAVAAALGNSGLAAWMPLEWRARLAPGETVLVLGAGICARLAIQVAKELGARRVVAGTRSEEGARRALDAGADAAVAFDASCDAPAALRHAAGGTFDVVVDYLWGNPARAALRAIGRGGRFVQVGTMAGDDLALSGALMRQQSIDVLGFAIYHAPLEVRRAAYTRLCVLARDGRLRVDVERMSLADVAVAFARQSAGERRRLVLVP